MRLELAETEPDLHFKGVDSVALPLVITARDPSKRMFNTVDLVAMSDRPCDFQAYIQF